MSDETVYEVLAHFGVKGMRWGVRKTSSGVTAVKKVYNEPQDVTVRYKPNKPIQTTGGKYHPPSEDAIKSASLRQKSKSSGLQSLSNAQIKTVVDRMNLEQQYSKLNPRQKSRGQRFMSMFIKSPAPDFAINVAKGKYKNVLDPKSAAYNATIAQRIMIAEQLAKAVRKG